jgi:hypothetical protein
MKAIKTIAFGLFIFSSTLVFSQKTAEEKANAQTNKMKTELNLTEEQVPRVKEINLGIIQKNENIMNNATMSETEKREIIKSNNEARKAMLKNVLTSEQYTKLELIIAEKKIEKMKAKRQVKDKVKNPQKD